MERLEDAAEMGGAFSPAAVGNVGVNTGTGTITLPTNMGNMGALAYGEPGEAAEAAAEAAEDAAERAAEFAEDAMIPGAAFGTITGVASTTTGAASSGASSAASSGASTTTTTTTGTSDTTTGASSGSSSSSSSSTVVTTSTGVTSTSTTTTTTGTSSSTTTTTGSSGTASSTTGTSSSTTTTTTGSSASSGAATVDLTTLRNCATITSPAECAGLAYPPIGEREMEVELEREYEYMCTWHPLTNSCITAEIDGRAGLLPGVPTPSTPTTVNTGASASSSVNTAGGLLPAGIPAFGFGEIEAETYCPTITDPTKCSYPCTMMFGMCREIDVKPLQQPKSQEQQPKSFKITPEFVLVCGLAFLFSVALGACVGIKVLHRNSSPASMRLVEIDDQYSRVV